MLCVLVYHLLYANHNSIVANPWVAEEETIVWFPQLNWVAKGWFEVSGG